MHNLLGFDDNRYQSVDSRRLSRRKTIRSASKIPSLPIGSLSYRFHSCLNRFESLESLEFSVFSCGALDRNMLRFDYLIREDGWSSALKSKSAN
jgi:hypothetical protein